MRTVFDWFLSFVALLGAAMLFYMFIEFIAGVIK